MSKLTVIFALIEERQKEDEATSSQSNKPVVHFKKPAGPARPR